MQIACIGLSTFKFCPILPNICAPQTLICHGTRTHLHTCNIFIFSKTHCVSAILSSMTPDRRIFSNIFFIYLFCSCCFMLLFQRQLVSLFKKNKNVYVMNFINGATSIYIILLFKQIRSRNRCAQLYFSQTVSIKHQVSRRDLKF